MDPGTVTGDEGGPPLPETESFNIDALTTGGEGEFVKQLGGSGAANMLTVALLAIMWLCKNKCKRSECRGSTFCFSFKVNDDDEGSNEDEDEEEGGQKRVPVQARS